MVLAEILPVRPPSPRNPRGHGRRYVNSRIQNKRARYQAFPDGTVVNLNTKRQVRGSWTGEGYLMLPTGEMKHRLIARQLLENLENKAEINHKNGIKHDNRIENLEWVTPQENKRHYHEYLKPMRKVQALKPHACPHCKCPECMAVEALLTGFKAVHTAREALRE